MTQTCPVSITWERQAGSSVALVASGDWIGSPLSANGQQEVFDVPGMGVAEAYFRALGGAVVDLTFTLEVDESTLAAALGHHLDMQANWIGLDGKSGTLTIESTDADDLWEAVFTPCALAEISPALPSGTGAATIRRALRFVSAPPTFTDTAEEE